MLALLLITAAATFLGIIFAVGKFVSTKKLLYLTIILLPFDLYRLPTDPVNISFFRVLLIMTFSAFVIDFFRQWLLSDSESNYQRNIPKRKLYAVSFLVLAVISLFLSVSVASNFIRTVPMLSANLAGIIFALLIISIPQSRSDVLNLTRAFAFMFSAYIVSFLYTYYQWNINNQKITEVPLYDILPYVTLVSEFEVHTTSGLPRLALPLTQPPHTSLALAMGIFLMIGYTLLCDKRIYSCVAATAAGILFVALFATVSRSGIFTFAIVGPLILCFLLINTKSVRNIAVVSVFLMGSLILLLMFLPEQIILSRIQGSIQNHLASRINAIQLWLSDPHIFIHGVGLYNYIFHVGSSTPESTYVKFLAERGIIGTALTLPIYIYPAVYLSRNVANADNYNLFYINLTWLAIALTILVGELFYDFVHMQFAWLALGLSMTVAIHFQPNVDGKDSIPEYAND